MSNTDTEKREDVGQYVTFLLDSELYAVDVLNARTVIHEAEITRIPHMEDYVAGIIDFRGHGIPLVDLKVKLGIADRPKTSSRGDRGAVAEGRDSAPGPDNAAAADNAAGRDSAAGPDNAAAAGGRAATTIPPDSAVLILELPQGDHNITVGVIVDEVHEVISLNEGTIEPAPAVGSACDLEFLRGIARDGDTFLLVLHAEKILESGEIAGLTDRQVALRSR